MIPTGHDSLNTRSTLEAGGKTYAYYSLPKAGEALGIRFCRRGVLLSNSFASAKVEI